MRSVWSPKGFQFYLTFLVDPQLDLHRQRKKGEGVWAVSASTDLPTNREQAEGQILFSFGHGLAERLSHFISDVSRLRHGSVVQPYTAQNGGPATPFGDSGMS
jgi:hypothetical protein